MNDDAGGYVDISKWHIFKTVIFLIVIAVLGFISFLWLELRRLVGRIR